MAVSSPSSEKESKATKELKPRNPAGIDSISERSAINQGLDSKLSYLKWYLTSKEGWLGDYVGGDALLNSPLSLLTCDGRITYTSLPPIFGH